MKRYVRKSIYIVILFIILFLSCRKKQQSKIELTTVDRKNIDVIYYPSVHNFAPAIVLVPSIEQGQATLKPLAESLQQNGFAVITFDFREQNSFHKENQRVLRQYTKFDYPRLKFDVQSATEYLMKKEEIDKYKIIIVAYNSGIEPSLRYASENDMINSTVLICPVDMEKNKLKEMLNDYGKRHLLVIANLYQQGCYETSKFLYDNSLANERNKKLVTMKSNKKGIDCLDERSLDYLLNWLKDEATWK